MTLEELKEKMKEVNKDYENDPEVCHGELDDLLLEYINDDGVKKLFDEVVKWYA